MNHSNHLPKLILFDIDGTLVNTSWDMTPATREGLIQLHEKGVLLGIASGRPSDDIQFHIQKWDLPFDFDVYIGLNGCELQNNVTGQHTMSHLLEEKTLKTVIEGMKEAGFDFIPFIYRDKYILAEKVNDVIEWSARKSGKIPTEVPAEELYSQPCAKVMLRTKDGKEVQKMERWLETHSFHHTKGFKTQTTLMEFAHPDISKAVPMPILCQQLGITLHDITACGDTTNDNEMLQLAGTGICLVNGTEDTKACADQITEEDNDHDGLIRHLRTIYPQLFTES